MRRRGDAIQGGVAGEDDAGAASRANFYGKQGGMVLLSPYRGGAVSARGKNSRNTG